MSGDYSVEATCMCLYSTGIYSCNYCTYRIFYNIQRSSKYFLQFFHLCKKLKSFVVLQLAGEYSEVVGLVVQKSSELLLFLQYTQFL